MDGGVVTYKTSHEYTENATRVCNACVPPPSPPQMFTETVLLDPKESHGGWIYKSIPFHQDTYLSELSFTVPSEYDVDDISLYKLSLYNFRLQSTFFWTSGSWHTDAEFKAFDALAIHLNLNETEKNAFNSIGWSFSIPMVGYVHYKKDHPCTAFPIVSQGFKLSDVLILNTTFASPIAPDFSLIFKVAFVNIKYLTLHPYSENWLYDTALDAYTPSCILMYGFSDIFIPYNLSIFQMNG